MIACSVLMALLVTACMWTMFITLESVISIKACITRPCVRARGALWRTCRNIITQSSHYIARTAVTVTGEGTWWSVSSSMTYHTLCAIVAFLTVSHTFFTLASINIIALYASAPTVVCITHTSFTSYTARLGTVMSPVPSMASVATTAIWTRSAARVRTLYTLCSRRVVVIYATVTRVSLAWRALGVTGVTITLLKHTMLYHWKKTSCKKTHLILVFIVSNSFYFVEQLLFTTILQYCVRC